MKEQVGSWHGPVPVARHDVIQPARLLKALEQICVRKPGAAVIALEDGHIQVENVFVYVPPVFHVRSIEGRGGDFRARKIVQMPVRNMSAAEFIQGGSQNPL